MAGLHIAELQNISLHDRPAFLIANLKSSWKYDMFYLQSLQNEAQ